jgi:CubicO group peptidase (beta-lactamase class C family)
MKKSLCLLVFIIIISFQGNIKAQTVPITGVSVPEMAALDSAMAHFIKLWKIPGASVGMVYDQRLVYARGFGYADVDSNKYLYPNSLMRIASTSKSFTGICCMKLIQDGLLHLTDTIFGPHGILNDTNYQNILDPRYKKITLENLLQHTSGTAAEGGNDPQYDGFHIAKVMGTVPPADAKTTIKYMLKYHTLDFAPGTAYQYSNLGYNIIGRVIEKITGYPTYEEYMTNEILGPITAYNTRIGKDFKSERFPNEVIYYDMKWDTTVSCYDSVTIVPESYGTYHLRTMDSHGGWITNPTEMMLLLTGVDGFPGRPDFFTPATISTMTTGSAANPNYAMGFVVDTNGKWQHNGALTTGVCSFWVRQADGIEYAVIFNRLPLDSSNFVASLDSFITEANKLIPDAITGITTWPTHDLFSGIGEQQQTNNSLAVFPNPFDNFVTIRFYADNQSEGIINVYNMQGKIISSVNLKLQNGLNEKKIEMSGFASGIYLIKLISGDKMQYVKVIKK